MSHRVSAKEASGKQAGVKSEIEMNALKTTHLEELERMMMSLKGERVKENQLTEQVIGHTQALGSIREMLTLCNTSDGLLPFRVYPGGWSMPCRSAGDAVAQLTRDQRLVEDELGVLRTQRRMCRERQVEILRAIGRKASDVAMLGCFKPE